MNSLEIFGLYIDNGGKTLSRRTLIYKLSEICGKDLLVLSGNGVASLLLFRSRASSLLHLVATDTEEEDERAMDRIAQKIAMESRDCWRNGNVYQTKIKMDIALQPVSPTLLTLLRKVSGKLGSTAQGAMIGNYYKCHLQYTYTIAGCT